MGYEVKMLIGEVSGVVKLAGRNRSWFRVAAMVELSKPGGSSQITMLSSRDNVADELADVGEPVYLYCLDGNKEFTADQYGKNLRAIPASDVLKALKEDAARDNYWRFPMAIAVLKAVSKGLKHPSVVLFGH